MVAGSLTNDDGDGNENGKKAVGLDKQNNYFARVSRFFVHFSAVFAQLNVKLPNFTFSRRREQKATTFFFFSWTFWSSPLEFNSKTICQLWRIKRDGISAVKFEAAQIHFLSGVFVAVAVVVA